MDIKQIKQLAERGEAKAQHELGRRYLVGEGVSKDYNHALKWLQKAAEQGFAEASYLLGTMYLNGMGVMKDSRLADKWLSLASHQGYSQEFTIDSINIPEGFMQNLADRANQGDIKAQELLEGFKKLMF